VGHVEDKKVKGLGGVVCKKMERIESYVGSQPLFRQLSARDKKVWNDATNLSFWAGTS
jgi:hypothetical protein